MNKDAIARRDHIDEVDTVALAASLLYTHGQTTEKTVVAAQQLGRTLGVPVRVLPHWDELVVELDHTSFSEIVPAAPLGVDMGKVLAVETIMHQVCDGAMSTAAARPALVAAGRMPPVAILRFAVFAAIGAASLGVIFGVYDVASLVADRPERRRRSPCPSLAGEAWRQSFPRTAVRGHGRRRDRRRRKSPPPFRRAIARRVLPLHGAGSRPAYPQRCDRPCAHTDHAGRRTPDLCRSRSC